jgi:hypothetical protein
MTFNAVDVGRKGLNIFILICGFGNRVCELIGKKANNI